MERARVAAADCVLNNSKCLGVRTRGTVVAGGAAGARAGPLLRVRNILLRRGRVPVRGTGQLPSRIKGERTVWLNGQSNAASSCELRTCENNIAKSRRDSEAAHELGA